MIIKPIFKANICLSPKHFHLINTLKSIIDKVEETSPEFIEATRIFFKAELNKKNKQLKECQEDLEIVKDANRYLNSKYKKLKNKYYKLINEKQNEKDQRVK